MRPPDYSPQRTVNPIHSETANANHRLLTMENVSVGYERRAVLADVNLSITRGSFTGVLGANGSGKSTLLKSILGIQPLLSGTLNFASGRAPLFGYVPQRDALDAVYLLSSFEVVLMGVCGRVGPFRFPPNAEKEFIRQCLRQAGVEDLARSRFSELSGGQKQRVLIARALATRPELLVLDEPTAGIDSAASQAVIELLGRIHREQRMTILMVNHDLHTVRRCVNEVIWIHDGRVRQGPVEVLLSREKMEEILALEVS